PPFARTHGAALRRAQAARLSRQAAAPSSGARSLAGAHPDPPQKGLRSTGRSVAARRSLRAVARPLDRRDRARARALSAGAGATPPRRARGGGRARPAALEPRRARALVPPLRRRARRGRVQRMSRRVVRVALLAALVVACVLFVRRLDGTRLAAALRSASLPVVLLAAATNFLQIGVRSLFLGALLAPLRQVGLWRLCRYNLAMFAANNLLPARAGELVRIEL